MLVGKGDGFRPNMFARIPIHRDRKRIQVGERLRAITCRDPAASNPLTKAIGGFDLPKLGNESLAPALVGRYAAMAWARRRTVRTVMSSSWPKERAASAM